MLLRYISFTILILATAMTLFVSSVAGSNRSCEICVQAVSDRSPDNITIQGDREPQPTSLSRDPSQPSRFKGSIELTSAEDEKTGSQQPRMPYVLVGIWGESSEQVYLGLGLGIPKKIEIEIFHEEVSENLATLERIEALGTDHRNQLKRYFLSRAYHRKWRHQLNQPYHQVALFSAKLWFDSSAWLAMRTNSIYLMDQEIVEIMKEYEELAKRDKRFRDRYRRYVRSGYVEATIEQTIAAPFSVVGIIPTLIESRKLDEALDINTHMKAVLANQTSTTKRLIEKHQKVNTDLLEKNENYIQTLRGNRDVVPCSK